MHSVPRSNQSPSFCKVPAQCSSMTGRSQTPPSSLPLEPCPQPAQTTGRLAETDFCGDNEDVSTRGSRNIEGGEHSADHLPLVGGVATKRKYEATTITSLTAFHNDFEMIFDCIEICFNCRRISSLSVSAESLSCSTPEAWLCPLLDP